MTTARARFDRAAGALAAFITTACVSVQARDSDPGTTCGAKMFDARTFLYRLVKAYGSSE